MEIAVLCGIYLVELVCYRMGIRILFGGKQKVSIWMLVGIMAPVIVGMLPVPVAGKNVMITLTVMCIQLITIGEKGIEKIVKIAFTLLFISLLDDIFICFEKDVFNFQNEFVIGNSVGYLVTKSFTAVCVMLVYVVKRKIQFHKAIHINSLIYAVIGIIASSMMFCLAVLNYAKPYLKNPRYIILCSGLNISVRISIFFLVFFIIYIKNTHERMERLLKTEQLLKETQVNYYRQLLKKEDDTRKYRHDMNNHLFYLKELLDKGQREEAMLYLEQVQGGFQNIQKTYYVTGNEMVDAIMNYFFGMLPMDVNVKIPIKIPIEFEMEDVDICTIFSNLFQNVVEEIQYYSIENAQIEIVISKGREYVKYEMRNTTHIMNVGLSDGEGKLPLTSKLDKRNHGIGLSNVKTTVEKNDGRFSWGTEENNFWVCVILPIKTTA